MTIKLTHEQAVHYIGKVEYKDAFEYEAMKMAIEALKAEPQKKYPTEWCEQCTLWEDNKCMGVAHCKSNIEALKPLMNDDLISRAEAIEAIELVDWYHQNRNKDMVSGANSDEHQAWYKADDVYKALEAVPSADRPQGEWIEQEDDYHHYWECSECGMGVGLDDIRNFCPNCGADMRSE